MSGVLYAIFAIAILFIIAWYVQNERAGIDSDGSKGLLAMRSTREPESAAKPDKRWRSDGDAGRAQQNSNLKPM